MYAKGRASKTRDYLLATLGTLRLPPQHLSKKTRKLEAHSSCRRVLVTRTWAQGHRGSSSSLSHSLLLSSFPPSLRHILLLSFNPILLGTLGTRVGWESTRKGVRAIRHLLPAHGLETHNTNTKLPILSWNSYFLGMAQSLESSLGLP